jgi:hypothetical protein
MFPPPLHCLYGIRLVKDWTSYSRIIDQPITSDIYLLSSVSIASFMPM